MSRKRAESGAEKGFAASFAFTNPFAGEPCEEDKSELTWEQRDSQLGELVHRTEKAGTLQLKTISGWTPKWCKINFITRTICMFNDERDGIARAVIELKNVMVRAIDDDEGHPYVFVLYAGKSADKVTHKLASTSKRDFDQWVEAFSEVTTVDRQRERRSVRLTPDMIPTRKTVTERSIKNQNMNTQAILQGGRKRRGSKPSKAAASSAAAAAKDEPPAETVAKSEVEEEKVNEGPRLVDNIVVSIDDGYARPNEEEVAFETANPAVFQPEEKDPPSRTRSRSRLIRGRSYSQLPPDERKAMRDAQAGMKRTPSQIKRNPTLDLIEQVVAEEEGLDVGRIAPIEDDAIPSGNDTPVEGRRSFSLAELAAFAASKVTTTLSPEPPPASEETAPLKQRPAPLEVLHNHESRDDIKSPNSAAVREAQLSSAQVINETSAQVARIQYVPRKTGIRIRAIHHVADSMQFSDDELQSISAGLEDDRSEQSEHDDHEDAEAMPAAASYGEASQDADSAIPPPPPQTPALLEAAAQTDEVPPPPPPQPEDAVTADAEEVSLPPPPPPLPAAADVQPEIEAVDHSETATELQTVPAPPSPPPAVAEAADAAVDAVEADVDGTSSKVDVPAEVVQQVEEPATVVTEPATVVAGATVAAATIAALVEGPSKPETRAEEPPAKPAPSVTRQKSEKATSGPPKLRRGRNDADAAPEQTPEETPKGKSSKSKPGLASNPPQLSRRVVAAPKASSNSKKCGYLQWRNNATAEWSLQWCALDFASDVLDIYANEKASQPLMSFSMDSVRLTGRLVPRALKAIRIRDEQAKGGRFLRPKKQRNQQDIPQEFSDRSLANTIVPQDKLILTLQNATRVGPELMQENVSLKCISPKDFEDWVRSFRLVVKEVQEDPSEAMLEPHSPRDVTMPVTAPDATTRDHHAAARHLAADFDEAEERKSFSENPLLDAVASNDKLPSSPVSVAVRSSDLSKTDQIGAALVPPPQSNSPNRFRAMSREDRQAMLSHRRAGPAPKASTSSKKCGYLQWKNQGAANWTLKWCALDFANDVLDLYDTDQAQEPLLSYILDHASLAGRLVPRAVKAINNREQEAKGVKRNSRPKRGRAPEQSDRPLTDTVVPQDKLTFTIHDLIVVGADESKQDVYFRCISPKDFEDWVRHFRMVVAEVQENVAPNDDPADSTPNVYNILSPEAVIIEDGTAVPPQRRGILGLFKRSSQRAPQQQRQPRSQSVSEAPAPRRSRLRGLFSRRRADSNASEHDGLPRKGSMAVEVDSDMLQPQHHDMSHELEFYRDQYNIKVDDDTESEVASVATSEIPPPPPPPPDMTLSPVLEHEPEPVVDPVQAAFALHAQQFAAYKPVFDANGVLAPPPLPFKPPPPPSRKDGAAAQSKEPSEEIGLLARLKVTTPSQASAGGGGLLQEIGAVRTSLRHIPLVVDTTRGRARTSSRARADSNSPIDDILRLRAHVAGHESEEEDESDNEFEDDF